MQHLNVIKQICRISRGNKNKTIFLKQLLNYFKKKQLKRIFKKKSDRIFLYFFFEHIFL